MESSSVPQVIASLIQDAPAIFLFQAYWVQIAGVQAAAWAQGSFKAAAK